LPSAWRRSALIADNRAPWSPRNPRASGWAGSAARPQGRDARPAADASPSVLRSTRCRPASTSRARAWTRARCTSWPRASRRRA
jgi:hypothetical protein